MKTFKTAVIGCGSISDIYFKNMIETFSVLNVAACCDLNQDAAGSMAGKYNLKPISIEDIIADKSIEIVVNLTNPAAHYPVTKRLLENGKHVYSEKTLAANLTHAGELVTLADKNSLYLGAAPDTFLGSGMQTARFAVESGMIGDVTSCYAAVNRDSSLIAEKYPHTVLAGSGIGMDIGIYYVTALLSILGPVTEICGMYDTYNKNRRHFFVSRDNFGESYTVENENIITGSFRFASGILGSIHINANSIMNEKPQLVVYGSQGIIYMPDPDRFGGEVRVLLKGQNESFTLPPTHGYSDNSRGLGVAEMAWAISAKRQPRASKEMAYHALELLVGLMESCDSKAYYQMKSTFNKTPPLPRGYFDSSYFMSQAEAALSF